MYIQVNIPSEEGHPEGFGKTLPVDDLLCPVPRNDVPDLKNERRATISWFEFSGEQSQSTHASAH
jgi:hypothetical protein